MQKPLTRRVIIKYALLAGAALPLGLAARVSNAQAGPVDPNDPAAKGLGYVLSSANPAQNCGNCTQYKGAAGSAKGGCAIFPGKEVPATAYCKAWVKKAA